VTEKWSGTIEEINLSPKGNLMLKSRLHLDPKISNHISGFKKVMIDGPILLIH